MSKSFRLIPPYKSSWPFLLLFPSVIFYYETVFRLSTTGTYWQLGTVYMLLFSVVYGGISYLLSTISHNKKTNHIIATVLLGLCSVPYFVEYFVYRQFKVLYDVNTMVGGAGGVMTGFMGHILQMIFSWDGLFKIVLFVLPIVLYAVFGRKYLPAVPSVAIQRVIVVIGMLIIYLFNTILILCFPYYNDIYNKQYDFQSAVSSFGLLTGLRLDVTRGAFPEDVEFENTGATIPTTTTTTTNAGSTDGPGTTVVYGKNEMSFDFSALKQTASKDHATLDKYIQSLTPSSKNKYTGMFKGKNLIMITAEAFTAEVIDPELTPTLYRMATKGINFTDYYQPASAGTTGGEYQNLFGMLPTAGGKSLKNTATHNNYFTLGSQLNRLGYFGMAFHNNTHTFYDRHKTHINLGYSNGYMGYGNGMENYVKKQWPQSDCEMIMGTLPTYIDQEKFNVYYMTVSGHNGYTKTGNAMTRKHWSRVEHLEYSDTVKGYLAANLDLEDAMTQLIAALEDKGIADDTVIVISTDHFPYGLDTNASLGNMPYLSELYGYSVENYFQRDHNRLILWSGCLENDEPIIVDTPTSSLDILPTLSNLFGTEFDSRLFVGRDVFSDATPLVFNASYQWKTDLGTYIGGKFIPNENFPEDMDQSAYVKAVKSVVNNKMNYCKLALNSDYFEHLFPGK